MFFFGGGAVREHDVQTPHQCGVVVDDVVVFKSNPDQVTTEQTKVLCGQCKHIVEEEARCFHPHAEKKGADTTMFMLQMFQLSLICQTLPMTLLSLQIHNKLI